MAALGNKPPDWLRLVSLLVTTTTLAIEVPKLFINQPAGDTMAGLNLPCNCKGDYER
jgi:hypothetical protein